MIITYRKLMVSLIVLGLITCISGIYALTSIATASIENGLSTDAVNVELTEYGVNNKLYSTEPKDVSPGDTIDLRPEVSNLGIPAYIRVKITYTDNYDQVDGLNDDIINGMSSDWIKKGDYYYYKNIVGTDEKIDIFESVTIPEDWTSEHDGQILNQHIIVEAVQSKNFKMDLESETPWGGLEIEECVDDSYKTDKISESSTLNIEYENGAEKYVKVPDDFFDDLYQLVPGDNIKDSIVIKNTTKQDAEYFFYTNSKESKIKDLILIIKMADQEIYNGSLYHSDKYSLGKLKPGEEKKIHFEIQFPKDLGNSYSLLNTKLNWYFIVNYDGKISDESIPKTGDAIVYSLITFAISLIGFVLLLTYYKKEKKKEERK